MYLIPDLGTFPFNEFDDHVNIERLNEIPIKPKIIRIVGTLPLNFLENIYKIKNIEIFRGINVWKFIKGFSSTAPDIKFM